MTWHAEDSAVTSTTDQTVIYAGTLIDWIGAAKDNCYTRDDQTIAEGTPIVNTHLKEQGRMDLIIGRNEEE